MSKKIKNLYIDPDDLMESVKDYLKTGVMSNRLGSMILEIARNFSSKGSFRDYTWVDDMVGEAALTCVKYLKRFDPNKSNNPFAYITTICRNSFIQYIKKQKKHSNIKDVCFNKKGQVSSIGIDEEGNICTIGIDYRRLKPIRKDNE